MNEFENKLIIKEEEYKGGLFPTIPKYNKRGSAFILSGGIGDDIVVNEYTTIKEIRQGKYTKLVEISTSPYLREIRFRSPSKESAYSFDVYVKAVIQVEDPIVFFQNKNIDVDAYFDNLFSLDVRKITKKYSILDYYGMDEELTHKLSSYNTIDEATGFNYRISVVDAIPGDKAQKYVEQNGTQELDAGLKVNARRLAALYTSDYEEAIRTEVAEGKRTEAEAALLIKDFKNQSFSEQIERIETLREKGFITNQESRKFVYPVLEGVGVKKQIDNLDEQNNIKKVELDKFYTEEEE